MGPRVCGTNVVVGLDRAQSGRSSPASPSTRQTWPELVKRVEHVRRSRICRTEDAIARSLLKTLTGLGAIHAGDVPLRTARYELSLWSDDRQTASEEDLDAVASIEGHIDITGIAEAVVLAGPGTLTLTLEDGRRLAFELTGTGGAIVGRGWLP